LILTCGFVPWVAVRTVIVWFPLLPLPLALILEADANIADHHAILHVPRLQIHGAGPVFGDHGAWECATLYHVNVIADAAVGVVVEVAL